jgi:hypothetical protein
MLMWKKTYHHLMTFSSLLVVVAAMTKAPQAVGALVALHARLVPSEADLNVIGLMRK